MSAKWTQQDIPDLSGKIIVVTGGNSGLGYECAKTFASKGATVILAVRSIDKGETAKSEILKAHPNASIEVIKLDVGDLSSVRAFADAFTAEYQRLDILLNNAGVMAIPRQETVDGFEMQLGVNHLGHFALTGLLLEIIVNTPGARIHNVTSSANYSGTINFDDLMGEENYGRWSAYGQSKLANVFFTYELQKRLTAAGYDTIVNTSHPGIVRTNLQNNSIEQSGTSMEALIYRLIEPIMMQDISMGVLSMLYAMTAEDAKGATFYGPHLFNMRGYPTEQKANKEADNADARKRFWEISEQLTGVHYTVLNTVPA